MNNKSNNHKFKAYKAILGMFLAVMLLTLATGYAAEVKQVDAFEQNKKIGRGVNIIGYDPIWTSRDQARFKEKFFKTIKEGGFSSVRINLYPFKNMETTAPYTIKDSWFEVADWAVENALKNDLMVILDMHEYETMSKDPNGNKEKFLAFWKQAAPHFKDSSENVIFELLNEPAKKLTPELWNEYLKEALAIIRESNPTRTVVIGPGFFNRIGVLNKLELPEDDRNIIVTIHYYEPHSFTHQGAAWSSNKSKTGIKWLGTEREKKIIVNDFTVAQKWAKKHNRPILLGEFGAYDKGDIDSRVRYTSAVARTAEQFGFSWTYWQFDSDFVVYKVLEEEWFEPIHNALIPPKE
ncbi:MAG: glycoside hydrolase family 5 protein [Phycisphaerae bacterium]|jgi:endoglucanase